VTIIGDTVIATNTPIYTDAMTDNTTDAVLVLASTYKPPTGSSCDLNQDKSECSIHLKNNFQTTDQTAVLAYAPFGPVAIKNNQIQFGAVYADNIEIKNNQSMTYDPRVERPVGFGPQTYVVQTWLELAP
jgi:oxalate decarboxylase/phosphoglucose isomerase-like protein (cupin superfamily)